MTHAVRPDLKANNADSYDVPFTDEVDLSTSEWFGRVRPGHYTLTAALDATTCLSNQNSPCGTERGIACSYPDGKPCDLRSMSLDHWHPLQLSQTVSFDILPASFATRPTPSTRLSRSLADAHIASWLASDSPRFVAWAAYFTLRDHPPGSVVGMRQWLQEQLDRKRLPDQHGYQVDEFDADDPETGRGEAARAVLDALVQLHVQLPAKEIVQVDHFNHVLALILALLPKHNEEALLGIYDRRRKDHPDEEEQERATGDPLLARIAAGALVRAHSKEFLQTLIKTFSLDLDYQIGISGDRSIWYSGPGCNQEKTSDDERENWPPMGSYGISGFPIGSTFIYSRHGRPRPPRPLYLPAIKHSQYRPLLGREVSYARHIARNYNFEEFPAACTLEPDLLGPAFHWLEQYGRHGEHFTVSKTFDPSVGEEQYHAALLSWLSGQVEVLHSILSDAGVAVPNLHVTMKALDYRGSGGATVKQGLKGTGTTIDYDPVLLPRPEFPGFPPYGLVIDSWNK